MLLVVCKLSGDATGCEDFKKLTVRFDPSFHIMRRNFNILPPPGQPHYHPWAFERLKIGLFSFANPALRKTVGF